MLSRSEREIIAGVLVNYHSIVEAMYPQCFPSERREEHLRWIKKLSAFMDRHLPEEDRNGKV